MESEACRPPQESFEVHMYSKRIGDGKGARSYTGFMFDFLSLPEKNFPPWFLILAVSVLTPFIEHPDKTKNTANQN